MRVAWLVALVGCRQVLGIPGETTVKTVAVHVVAQGTMSASDNPPQAMLSDGQTVDLVDGDVQFATPLEIGASYNVTTSAGCVVTSASSGTVSDVPPPSVAVICDGYLALADFGFSAPVDTSPQLSPNVLHYTTTGSYLTQSTFVVAHGQYSNQCTVSATGFMFDTPLPTSDGLAISFACTDPTHFPTRTRMFDTTLALTPPPVQFGYGKPDQPLATNDGFGTAVAASGRFAAVGVPAHNAGAGEVILFQRVGRTWTQIVVFPAPAAGANFGASVALLDEPNMNLATLMVGAPGTETAFVYQTNTMGGWSQIGSVGGSTGDDFGRAVAIAPRVAGVTAYVVGSPGRGSGRVTVFDTSFTATPLDAPIEPNSNEQFGAALAFAGTTLFVGAPGQDSQAPASIFTGSTWPDHSAADAGAVFVYTNGPTFSTPASVLKAKTVTAGDRFGASLAAIQYGTTSSSQLVLVGAPNDAATAMASGAVYAIRNSNAQWTTIQPQTVHKAPAVHAGDHFGATLSVAGIYYAVGAPDESSAATGVFVPSDPNLTTALSDTTKPKAGAVYVYDYTINDGAFRSYMKASNSDAGDTFGTAIALTPEALLVGAPGESSDATGWNGADNNNTANAGAVYSFR